MRENDLPPFARHFGQKEAFTFACHPTVPCFTECCRKLDLPLTPYDVLRLKNCLGLSSQQFLETFAEMEEKANGGFPGFFLAMLDDEQQHCPFVDKQGCSVYAHRPAPCRFYPVGRGVSRNSDDSIHEQFILVEENHCRGFHQGRRFSIADWTADQELEKYIEFNDLFAAIVQHAEIRSGAMHPDARQREFYILSLYNLDLFRHMILQGDLHTHHPPPVTGSESESARDEAWLRFALEWLGREIFA